MERTIPISGRVAPGVVKYLTNKAERLEVSLSKVVGMELSGIAESETVLKEKCKLLDQKWRKVTGELIKKFSDTREEQKAMIEFLAKQIEKA